MHSNILTLKQWWHQKEEANSEMKLRYLGWDHKTRFFKLLKFDDKTNSIEGELDCGKKVSFAANSEFWVAYDDGMENEARAI
jgi:hypothetical protein